MKSAASRLTLAITVLVVGENVSCGSSYRRLGRLVRVPDLTEEDKSERKPSSSIQQLKDELEMAQEEIHRLLLLDGAKYSMSMPMPVGTLSPKPEPTTAPVSKSPVTSPPVDIIITISPLETVSTDAPATPATPAPIDLVVTSDPVTAAPVMSPIETAMTEPPITLAPAESSTPVTLVPAQLPTSPPMASLPTESPVSERDLMIAEKCGITPLERSESLLSIATTLFSLEDLSNPLSPSTASLDWVDNEDPAILCPDGNRVSQRLVVSNMYFSMDGAAWINCGVESDECVNTDERITREPRRWLTSSHECLWYGLFCEGVSGEETPSVDEILHLTVVDLPDNNMGGTVPLSLFHLGKLQILTMDGNGRIAGSIPSDIAKLTSLTVIDIDENMLTGTLPIELYSLTNLEAIDLNNNKLTGSLPLNIGNLKNLGVLQLENNRMAGPIPEAGLFMLERMVLLTLENNSFTGSVEQLCSVKNDRRIENNFPSYLQFFHVDCAGEPPKVECTCCNCFPK